MSTQPTPSLKLKRVLSNPRDPAEVLGFQGRNKLIGKPAILLKRSVTPTDGPYVGIPDEAAGLVSEQGYWLYVLDEANERVIGMTPDDFDQHGAVHTFDDWHGEPISCQAFHGDDATVWSRDAVEVSN